MLQAPAVPTGAHLAYWDSGKTRTLVNARGMELGNHWGPVDAHTELPEERLAELFGLHSTYYEPPKAGSKPVQPRQQQQPLAAGPIAVGQGGREAEEAPA